MHHFHVTRPKTRQNYNIQADISINSHNSRNPKKLSNEPPRKKVSLDGNPNEQHTIPTKEPHNRTKNITMLVSLSNSKKKKKSKKVQY